MSEFWSRKLRDAPVGAEPSLLVDLAGTNPDARLPISLPLEIDEQAVLAAFAFVLARASAHPEPTGKALLVGVPLPATTESGYCLMPLELIVNETSPFRALVTHVRETIEEATPHALPEQVLRNALTVSKTDRVVCATFIPSASVGLEARVRRDWSPDVQLLLSPPSTEIGKVATLIVDGRFDPQFASLLAGRLQLTIQKMTDSHGTCLQSDTPMRGTHLLTEPERELLLNTWTPKKEQYPGMGQTFHDQLCKPTHPTFLRSVSPSHLDPVSSQSIPNPLPTIPPRHVPPHRTSIRLNDVGTQAAADPNGTAIEWTEDQPEAELKGALGALMGPKPARTITRRLTCALAE